MMIVILFPFLMWAILFANYVIANEVIEVFKISDRDRRAVIRTADGGMKVYKVGDAVGENMRLIEVADKRIVLEEDTGSGTDTIIVRLENGGQKVERISKQPGKRPTFEKPGK